MQPHEMAIRAFRKAAELNPGLDEARLILSIVYLHVGLLDLAREEVEKALAINPDNTLARFRLGGIALFSGEYEEAVTLLSSIPAEASPSLGESGLAAALVHAGKTAEAEALADTFLAQNPGDEGGAMTSVKAILFARAGRRAEAERAIAVAIELGKDFSHFHHTAFNIGSAYALLGQPERALDWLEVAAADGFPCYPAFTTDPTLASLRKDPRFEALLGRIRERAERIRSGTLSPIA